MVRLIEAENAHAAALSAQADERAPYAWTLTDAYMKKAREEYSHADHADADRLSELTIQWADRAIELATAARAGAEALEEAVESVPDEAVRPPAEEAPPVAPPEGEKLENPWEDELLEEDL
jgi:hypothetical protein